MSCALGKLGDLTGRKRILCAIIGGLTIDVDFIAEKFNTVWTVRERFEMLNKAYRKEEPENAMGISGFLKSLRLL